jgi:hypothetical protein
MRRQVKARMEAEIQAGTPSSIAASLASEKGVDVDVVRQRTEGLLAHGSLYKSERKKIKEYNSRRRNQSSVPLPVLLDDLLQRARRTLSSGGSDMETNTITAIPSRRIKSIASSEKSPNPESPSSAPEGIANEAMQPRSFDDDVEAQAQQTDSNIEKHGSTQEG